MYTQLYEEITDALVDNGYIVIEDALENSLAISLVNSAKKHTYKEAAIAKTVNLHVDLNKRSDKTKWINEDNSIQSNYLKIMHELQLYLNRSLYLGISYYESHFALYEKGAFYEKHLDSFKNSKNRVVTTVYYLNEDWNSNNGGELIIHDNLTKKRLKVVPKANTLVVFLSEKFPHEVLPAKKKRYSIAGWFRVDRTTF